MVTVVGPVPLVTLIAQACIDHVPLSQLVCGNTVAFVHESAGPEELSEIDIVYDELSITANHQKCPRGWSKP